MDGRHGGRLFPFPGVFAKQNPKLKIRMDADALGRQDVGWFQVWRPLL
jgi:hypothetical protein